jgi:hypothetical protein
VNGSAGVIATVNGQPITVVGFIIVDAQIDQIDAVADPARIPRITPSILTPPA